MVCMYVMNDVSKMSVRNSCAFIYEKYLVHTKQSGSNLDSIQLGI